MRSQAIIVSQHNASPVREKTEKRKRQRERSHSKRQRGRGETVCLVRDSTADGLADESRE